MIFTYDKNHINLSISSLSIWSKEEIIFLSLPVTSELYSWSVICDRIKKVNQNLLIPIGEWVTIIYLKLYSSIEPLPLYHFCCFQENSFSQSHLIAILRNLTITPIPYTRISTRRFYDLYTPLILLSGKT